MNSKRPNLKLFLAAFATSLLSAIVLGAGEARACMCEVLSPEEQLRVSEAVFSGKVTSVVEATSGDPSPSPKAGLPVGGPITFEVEESWKGDMAKQVVVLYGEGGSSCGVDAREGERYLVYARRGEDGPCGRVPATGRSRSPRRRMTCGCLAHPGPHCSRVEARVPPK